MTAHALLSPSASKRWGSAKGCPASVMRSVGITSSSNPASRKGTAKHFVSAICLEKKVDPIVFLGRMVVFVSEIETPEKERECFAEDVNLATVILKAEFMIDDEFVSHCEIYVNYVNQYVALNGGQLFVEQRLSIEHITSEPEAKGTTDALVILPKMATIIDAKFGVSKVNAYEVVQNEVVDLFTGEITTPMIVEPNSQLAMYADAALVEHSMFNDFEHVTLVIVQPALNHISEYTMTVPDLKVYIEKLRIAADLTRSPDAKFNPTADNCFFCPARMTCEARQTHVLESVLGVFDDLGTAQPKEITAITLGDLYDKLDMIRDWCGDVEALTKDALSKGEAVVRSDGLRYKLVSGKLGNRQWANEQQVADMLRDMRLKTEQMFNLKLISPTDAEKLTKVTKVNDGEVAGKPVIGPQRWNKLKALITRADGKPVVALETDPRPELRPADSTFTELFDVPFVPQTVAAEPASSIVSDLFS